MEDVKAPSSCKRKDGNLVIGLEARFEIADRGLAAEAKSSLVCKDEIEKEKERPAHEGRLRRWGPFKRSEARRHRVAFISRKCEHMILEFRDGLLFLVIDKNELVLAEIGDRTALLVRDIDLDEF
jgi:hypothetical protein